MLFLPDAKQYISVKVSAPFSRQFCRPALSYIIHLWALSMQLQPKRMGTKQMKEGRGQNKTKWKLLKIFHLII